MKKWGIVLTIVAVVSIISEVLADSKKLEEPIVLDVVMDFDFNSIHVSYLFDTKKLMMIERIEINGRTYSSHPENWGFDLYGGGGFLNSSYVNAQYYSLYNAQYSIDDFDRQELLLNLPSVKKVHIYFSGHPEPYEADILIVPPSSDIGLTVNGWEREDGKMVMAIVAEETLTFTDITLANTFGKIKHFEKEEEIVSLPVTLQEGDKLQVELEEMVGTYPAQQAYIRVSGHAGDKTFNEVRGDLINQPPSAAWIKERVEKYLD